MADIKQFKRNEDQTLSRKITGVIIFLTTLKSQHIFNFSRFFFLFGGVDFATSQYIGPAPVGWRNLNSTGQIHLK